jgi:hypothetical protein
MKNNYINQFQRQMGDPYHHGGNKQEQSILSIEDAAINHSKDVWGAYFDKEYVTDLSMALTYGQVSIDDYKAGWRQREQHLIPIIQEMAAALKYWVSDSFISDREFNRKMADEDKAKLDKYKNLL